MSKRLSLVNEMELLKRRAVLMQLVDSSDRNLTYEEIGEKMRANRWVLARWPGYSAKEARSDLMDNLVLVEDDITALAGMYMVKHLEVIQRSIDRMEEIADDVDEKPHVRIAATNAVGPMLEKSIKIFGGYADTTIKVDKRELTLNLDQYKEIMRRAKEQEVIEGEVISNELITMSRDSNTKEDEEE